MRPERSEKDGQHSADILDWCTPFAAKVMARIHEYDDEWPKPHNSNNVVVFPQHKRRTA